MSGPRIPWPLLAAGGVFVLVVVFFPFVVLLWLLVSTQLLQARADLSPDLARHVVVTARLDGEVITRDVPIACIATVEGIATEVYFARTQFPDFTVLTARDGRVVIVKFENLCASDAAFGTPENAFVTDSAMTPTWVAQPGEGAELAVSLRVSAAHMASAADITAIRQQLKELRERSNWGAIVRDSNGQLINASNRFTGHEFDRIFRRALRRTDGAPVHIPDGALTNGFVVSQYHVPQGDTEQAVSARNFQFCALTDWSPQPMNAPSSPEYCAAYRTIELCSPSNHAGCSSGELIYRPGATVRAAFAEAVGGRDSDDRYASTGVAVKGGQLIVTVLDSGPVAPALEPARLLGNKHLAKYLVRN